MAETFSIGTHVTALWGHRWYAGVVDDVLDGGRAYEIAWAHEETYNEVPAADVRALAPASNEPSSRPKPLGKSLGGRVPKQFVPNEREWAEFRAKRDTDESLPPI